MDARAVRSRAARSRGSIELVHALRRRRRSTPSYAGDNLFVDTEPVRRLSRDLRADDGVEARGGSISTGSKRSSSSCAATATSSARGRAAARRTRKGVTRAQVLDARDALVAALDDFQRRAPTPTSRRCCTASCSACVDEYERLKAREGALDFLDLLLRARDLVRDDATVRRHFQAALHAHLRRRVPGHRSAAGGAAPAARRRRSGRDRWRHGDPRCPGSCSSSAIRSSRSTGSAAPTSASTCACVRAARRRPAPRRVELRKSFRSGPEHPARGQRRVRAGDGRRSARRCRRGYVPLEPSRDDHPGQPSVVALPVPEPYAQRFIAAQGDRAVAAGRGGRVRRLARHAERLDGHRAAQPGTRVCRSRRATSASCSAGSSATARTSRGRTSRRSKRAASGTCWSAAGRSTTARRSRRCARR